MDNSTETRIQPILEFLARTIGAEFGDMVETVYQGDVGMYPPTAFRDSNGNYKISVRIVVDGMKDSAMSERSPMGEYRTVTFNIIPMVNMVPHFEATPVTAYGEVELLEFVDQVYEYFRRTENIDLGGRAVSSRITSIDFDFEQRGELSIRAAAIRLEAKLYFENM